MARQSWVQDPETGKLVPREQYRSKRDRTHLISPDFYDYQSPIDDAPVHGRKQRREDLARHGCREYDPGEKADNARDRAKRDRDEGKAIEQHIRDRFA